MEGHRGDANASAKASATTSSASVGPAIAGGVASQFGGVFTKRCFVVGHRHRSHVCCNDTARGSAPNFLSLVSLATVYRSFHEVDRIVEVAFAARADASTEVVEARLWRRRNPHRLFAFMYLGA